MSTDITREYVVRRLTRLGACTGPGSAMEWIVAQTDLTPEQLWAACQCPDWMRWLAEQLGLWDGIAEAIATADRAYAEAIAPARRAYADEIRRLLPWSELAAAIGGASAAPTKETDHHDER